MPFYVNSSVIGVDLNNAADSAAFAPGSRVNGSQDSLWCYVEASGAITTGDLVYITSSNTALRCPTSGSTLSGTSDIAFAQFAFTSGQFGWVAKNGNNMYVAVSATCAPSAVLYVATTTGKLSTTSASGTLMGVSLATTTTGATAQVALANLTWPKWAGAGN